jgi:hypothetical protein
MKRTALITGASGGLGAALARLFAADGYDLIVVARNGTALTALADDLRARHGTAVRVVPADLGAPGAAARVWADATAAGTAIDVLVNNAGAGLYGPFAEHEPDALDAMLQLNVVALTALTRLALPGMRQRGWGRILNVASMVGFQPGGPRMAAYYATKAFVLSFSRGLVGELAGTGVRVTALCPGPTRTEFDTRAGAAGAAIYRRLPVLSAERVARAGYRALRRGRAVVVPGALAALLAFAGSLPPWRLTLAVNRWLLAGGRDSGPS